MNLEGENYPASSGFARKTNENELHPFSNIVSGFSNAVHRGHGKKYPDPIKRRAPKGIWKIVDDYAESCNPEIGGYMTEEMMDKALVKYLLTYRRRTSRI